MQQCKLAIAHAKDDLKSLKSLIANINFDQRTDGSGSPAELFLQRTLRVPGLTHIPTHLRGSNDLNAACKVSQDKQVAQTAHQRRPELFSRGQRAVLQNNLTKLWNIHGKIVSRRTHQGLPTDSYIVKLCSTGQYLCRSERNIRTIVADNVITTG